MTTTANPHPTLPAEPDHRGASPALSSGQQLVVLARQIDANQYRIVHLAATYDESLEWFHRGLKSPATWIARTLDIHTSTAREWIRVGHALRHLPLIDAAFAAGHLSYAKVRILTRYADPDNEPDLLDLAHQRTADRLTTAIAKHLADNGETDQQRDQRHHHARALTTWTDGDGMVIIRAALPPAIAKPILATIDQLLHQIATTPTPGAGAGEHLTPHANDDGAEQARGADDELAAAPASENADTPIGGPTDRDQDPPADASDRRNVTTSRTQRDRSASADASDRRSVATPDAHHDEDPSLERTSDDRGHDAREGVRSDQGERSHDASDGGSGSGSRRALNAAHARARARLPRTLADMRRRWQPTDNWPYPSLAQQRADAFVALFLGLATDLTTEIVIHVRGDGATFDDGTPITNSAIMRQLDGSFIRLMIHDTERRPVNASNRRRYPTTAQRRVAMEAHNHECVDCHSTDILELDHNPPYNQTGHTHTDELEPRCAPCHRAHHRNDHAA